VQWLSGAPYTLDMDSLLTSLDKAQTAQICSRRSTCTGGRSCRRVTTTGSCRSANDWNRRWRMSCSVHRRWENQGAYRDAITFATPRSP